MFAPPPRTYRETRPVRTGAAMIGFGAGLLWFLLLAAVSWSALSYLVIAVAGLVAAVVAVVLLAWRGDRGASAGLAVLTGLMGAVVTLLILLGFG
jgi:hypothetical protein